jgi:hypothetical protein
MRSAMSTESRKGSLDESPTVRIAIADIEAPGAEGDRGSGPGAESQSTNSTVTGVVMKPASTPR